MTTATRCRPGQHDFGDDRRYIGPNATRITCADCGVRRCRFCEGTGRHWWDEYTSTECFDCEGDGGEMA